MRELLAKRIALATGLLAIVAAVGFAAWQNRVRRPEPPPPASARPAGPPIGPPVGPIDAQAIAKGRAIYERELCATCHSIAGEGNTRRPLDGVGARLSAEEVRRWIAPPPEMESKLPARVFQAKQQFRQLSADELDALAQYLGSLRPEGS